MFTSKDFKSAIISKAIRLRDTADELSKFAVPEIKCEVVKLHDYSNNDEIEVCLNKVLNGCLHKDKALDFIYVIQLSDTNGQTISKLVEGLKATRSKDKDYSYSRINKEYGLSTIYVGRSKQIESRLKQHFGDCQKGVYSLHLLRWAKNIEIKLCLMSFDNVDDLVVQSVEDALWSALKPAFGREGKR